METKPQVTTNIFAEQFRALLEKGTHADIVFKAGEEKFRIEAHKAILSARSPYFEAMFRPGGMIESSKGEIEMTRYDKDSFKRMIEFIYTGEVLSLEKCNTADIISLLEISNEYLLKELGCLCEEAASKIVTIDNIGKFMILCARHELSKLRNVCQRFVHDNHELLKKVRTF